MTITIRQTDGTESVFGDIVSFSYSGNFLVLVPANKKKIRISLAAVVEFEVN